MTEEKHVLSLRISPALYEELRLWAEEDHRSVNGQIEAILCECIKMKNQSNNFPPHAMQRRIRT